MTTNIKSVEIRESEIEDIFALYPELLRTTLSLDQEPYLICRQKILPSGRLDLLYSHARDLILVELKIERFKKDFVRQTLNYKKDLIDLQNQGKLINSEIIPYLVCPNMTSPEKSFAGESGITAVCYDPGAILKEFYRRAPLDTRYFSLVPTDKSLCLRFEDGGLEDYISSLLRQILNHGGQRWQMYERIGAVRLFMLALMFTGNHGLSPLGPGICLSKHSSQMLTATYC